MVSIWRRIDCCPARLQEQSKAFAAGLGSVLVESASAGGAHRHGIASGADWLVVGNAGSGDHRSENDGSD